MYDIAAASEGTNGVSVIINFLTSQNWVTWGKSSLANL